jgi:outer membrane biosynthesis protein TonB
MSESEILSGDTAAEPVRWLDDPSIGASLRADLVQGATATVGGVDYATTLTALRGAITAQTGALAPAAIAGKSLGLKVALGGVLVIGAAAAWWGSRGEPTPQGAAIIAAPAGVVATKAAPEPAPARVEAKPAIVQPPQEPPQSEPALAIEPEPEVELAPAPKESRKPKAVESDDDRYLREAQLVAHARKQLATSATDALASTKKHGREFPKGALVEEARAIEIRALAKLGRADEAQREADDFLRDFGDGPHAAAVRRAIADDDGRP